MLFKRVSILMLTLVLAMSMVACGSGDSTPGATEEGSEDKDKDTSSTGDKIVVDFWHSMGGQTAEALEGLIDDFHEKQDEIEVNLTYQGSYEEAVNKLKSVQGTDEAPAIMQLYGIGTRQMIDTGDIVPMYKFIEEENYDTSQFEENILGYYSFDDKLYSMPFSTSNAIMFYNKDAFEEVGLDPDNPPQTYEEIEEAARKLTTDDRYGFGFMIYGWFFEQLMANQGALMVNNDNGRSGLADEAVFNGEEGLRIMNWLNDMYKEGISGNFGRKWDDIRAAFKSGKAAIIFDSSAGIAAAIEDSPFEVGTAPLPYPEGMEPQGAQLGGNSHWIMDGKPEEVQQAAWEVIKHLSSPESQAIWSVSTGYFPITKEAYDEEVLQQNLEENPQFKTPIEQMQNTKLIPATQGAAIGVIPEMRTTIEDQIERMYDGSVSPQEALDEAVEKVTKALDHYNKTTGQGK